MPGSMKPEPSSSVRWTVMTRAHYWLGVAFAQRVAARIALDRGARDQATATFDDAVRTFERIGARFEAQQTGDENQGAYPVSSNSTVLNAPRFTVT